MTWFESSPSGVLTAISLHGHIHQKDNGSLFLHLSIKAAKEYLIYINKVKK